jgi:hypothetical protein
MNEKALIEVFVGMASLVCLVIRSRSRLREDCANMAAIRRAKVGYSQIQRQDKMALSAP